MQELRTLETDLDTISDTLEKWRAGKHKFKSVSDSNNMVSRERELTKEVGKLQAKIEKLRVERVDFGSVDSDDERSARYANAASWAKIGSGGSAAAGRGGPGGGGPASSGAGARAGKTKPVNPARSTGKTAWQASELTLAQQMQAKMVADLQQDSEKKREAEVAEEEARGAQRQQEVEEDDDFWDNYDGSAEQGVLLGGESSVSEFSKDGFVPVKKAKSGAPSFQQQVSASVSRTEPESDEDDGAVVPAARAPYDEDYDPPSANGASTGAAKTTAASKNKKKKKNPNTSTATAPAASKQQNEDWALPKQERKKDGPSFFAQVLKFGQDSFARHPLVVGDASFETAASRLKFNPLGVGDVATLSAWKKFANTTVWDNPFVLVDNKRGTTSKRNSNEFPLQLKEDLGARMGACWRRSSAFLLNGVFFLFLLRGVRAKGIFSALVGTFGLQLGLLFGLADAVSTKLEGREGVAGSVAAVMGGQKMLVLRCVHGLLWALLAWEAVSASLWWHLFVGACSLGWLTFLKTNN